MQHDANEMERVHQIAANFVSNYYQNFVENANLNLNMYAQDSIFSHGEVPTEANKFHVPSTRVGVQRIREKFELYAKEKMKIRVLHMDAAPTAGNMNLVCVSGYLLMGDLKTSRFNQSFILAPNNAGGHYIRNDCLRIWHEEAKAEETPTPVYEAPVVQAPVRKAPEAVRAPEVVQHVEEEVETAEPEAPSQSAWKSAPAPVQEESEPVEEESRGPLSMAEKLRRSKNKVSGTAPAQMVAGGRNLDYKGAQLKDEPKPKDDMPKRERKPRPTVNRIMYRGLDAKTTSEEIHAASAKIGTVLNAKTIALLVSKGETAGRGGVDRFFSFVDFAEEDILEKIADQPIVIRGATVEAHKARDKPRPTKK